MTRIRLKPKSAEYADENEKKAPETRGCDMPGCADCGEHKAPRDRDMSGYYWFCFQHVQEYNQAWDYFAGMSTAQIEEHVIRSNLWDRPTRRYDNHRLEEELKRQAWKTYHYTDREPPKTGGGYKPAIDRTTPEYQALAVMGLEPPLDMGTIKARYKELAKKHHPDLNPDPAAGELLKSINMAYTILKAAFEKFETLPV
jgi:hypothetical protein